MTVEQAIEALESRLREYKRLVEEDPKNYAQWIDIANGFVMGVEAAVPGLYEAWGGSRKWNEWYREIHPAFK